MECALWAMVLRCYLATTSAIVPTMATCYCIHTAAASLVTAGSHGSVSIRGVADGDVSITHVTGSTLLLVLMGSC